MLPVNPNIFRKYDIRGPYPESLNALSAKLIGRAFGSEVRLAGQSNCLLAWDGRESSPVIKHAFSEGVLSTGCDVYEIGATPTAIAFWAIKRNKGSCAIVTGSHNPKQDNGIKMAIAGNPRSGEDIQILLSRIQLNLFHEGSGRIHPAHHWIGEYKKQALDGLELKRPLTVALDAGNGIGGPIAIDLLTQLGCDVIPIACDVDGDFPLHHPDPAKTSNLHWLQRTVTEQRADLGIALDGDADRMGAVDENGNIILPDRLSLLFAEDILQRHPGATCLFDVKCTDLLPRFIKKWEGKSAMIATGHTTMKKAIKETGAAFATELSGHILFNDDIGLGVDDGIYAALRLVEIISKTSLTFSDLLKRFPNTVSTEELHVPLEEETKFHTMNVITKLGFKGLPVETIDGLRIRFDIKSGTGWALVRASNTTACLTIRFEADNTQTLNYIQTYVKKELNNVLPDLELPFWIA